MKTAIDIILEILAKEMDSVTKNDDLSDRYWQTGIKHARDIVMEFKETEKQQIIDLCTEAYEMGLGHKEYSALETYTSTFETNKETLK